MGGDRGQTTLDYAVGMSVFLLVLVGMFAFLPSVFAPFTTDRGANTVVSDRAASRLADDLLSAGAGDPSALDRTCTEGFFDADGAVPAGCTYDTDAAALTDALGVSDYVSVNVTIREGGNVRSIGGTDLRAGPDVPASADVVTASRLVLLDGSWSHLLVRVW